MHSRSEAVPTNRLREAVALRSEATSVRQVAREIGLSPAGLQKFIDGAAPRSRTRRLLELWFARQVIQRKGELSHEDASAIIGALVDGIPAARRDEVLRRIVHELVSGFKASRRPVPPWLDALSEQGR